MFSLENVVLTALNMSTIAGLLQERSYASANTAGGAVAMPHVCKELLLCCFHSNPILSLIVRCFSSPWRSSVSMHVRGTCVAGQILIASFIGR